MGLPRIGDRARAQRHRPLHQPPLRSPRAHRRRRPGTPALAALERHIAVRAPIVLACVVSLALAGCASLGAPIIPPALPPASPGGCSPGWTMGSGGTCQRDPSNFGGPSIYFGPQVRTTPVPLLTVSSV